MMSVSNLWVEKYKPTKLADLILQDEHQRAFFQHLVDMRELPNMMFLGEAGTGKTSLVSVLLNELQVEKIDVLRLNCSDEKIDAIREKVKPFAYTMPTGKFKVVRLEEFDNIGPDAQKALREIVPEVSETCRFLITGNYKHQIIPAMHDRFQFHEFLAPDKLQVMVRGAEILEDRRVKFNEGDLETIVNATYPSIRRMIHLLEQCSTTRTLVLPSAGSKVQDWKVSLLTLLNQRNLTAARKLVCTQASKDELQDVYKFILQNLDAVPMFKNHQEVVIPLLAQYQYQHNFVADPEVQLAALFVELSAIK